MGLGRRWLQDGYEAREHDEDDSHEQGRVRGPVGEAVDEWTSGQVRDEGRERQGWIKSWAVFDGQAGRAKGRTKREGDAAAGIQKW